MTHVQVENVECLEGDHIKFDFLGKDSIRYENEVVVHPKVHALVKKFCQQTSDKKGELLSPAAARLACNASKIADVTGMGNNCNLGRLRSDRAIWMLSLLAWPTMSPSMHMTADVCLLQGPCQSGNCCQMVSVGTGIGMHVSQKIATQGNDAAHTSCTCSLRAKQSTAIVAACSVCNFHLTIQPRSQRSNCLQDQKRSSPETNPKSNKHLNRHVKKSSIWHATHSIDTTAGMAAKKPEDQLFETMDAHDLNRTLKELMDGLSVKVFRTYNASITLDRLLWEPSDSQVLDAKKADYDRANKEVCDASFMYSCTLQLSALHQTVEAEPMCVGQTTALTGTHDTHG